MTIPEDHLAKFHKMTDAKEMWEAIKSRFGGNDESKKMQKYILKQQFEGFSVSNSEGLHKVYDRVFEPDVKGSTASSSSTQNVAFVSENASSTNSKLEVNNARGLRRSTAPDTAAELVLLAEVSTASRIVSSQVIMSSTTSDVTYTSVYTESEPDRAFWGADDEEIPEGGIPRVIVLGYDGLPLQPVALPSPDITRPRCKSTTPPVSLRKASMSVAMFVQAHDPDYVPEPIYPEYIPLEEDHEFPAEEQPLPHIDSPTAESTQICY
ncbi:hypothetical protein Tco_0545120 [Tanacetum coccineum]